MRIPMDPGPEPNGAVKYNRHSGLNRRSFIDLLIQPSEFCNPCPFIPAREEMILIALHQRPTNIPQEQWTPD